MQHNYIIKNNEEAHNFSMLLNSFWSDFPSNENAEIILNYYLRSDNYIYIDNIKNNQIAFLIGFSTKNEDLVNLLICSNKLENRIFSLKDISNFYANDYGLNNILMNIVENLNSKNCLFDKSSMKVMNEFKKSVLDYFVYNIDSLDSTYDKTKFDLFEFLKLGKVKFEEDQFNVMTKLLESNHQNVFLELYQKINKKNLLIEIINNKVQSENYYNFFPEESKKLLDSLYLKNQLSANLIEKPKKKNIKI